MAASITKSHQPMIATPYVKRVFEITLTGVTEFDFGTNDHGFSNIVAASFNNETTEGDGLVQINKLVAGTASIGNVALKGFTSGDVVTVEITGN